MQVSVDIAMHPIANEFVTPIHQFIAALEGRPGVVVVAGPMSTQLYGEYQTIMGALNDAMESSFLQNDHLSLFTLRIARGDARALEQQHPRR